MLILDLTADCFLESFKEMVNPSNQNYRKERL